MTTLSPGAQGRTTKEAVAGGRTWPAGTLFTVTDYVSPEQADDGEAFYWGNATADALNDVYFLAEIVELIRSAEEMKARVAPGVEKILDAISGSVHGSYEGFEVSEADTNGNEVHFTGISDEGLQFVFTIKLTGIGKA